MSTEALIKESVIALVEKITIPTYLSPEPEEVPMYAEFRQHQGTTGNPYPNRVTTRVERKLVDREYKTVRLENEYVRIVIIPELGGRIFEAFDKKTKYHFLYRQSNIKPVLVGAYGSWISGGMEFNFPFHHRPSTYMPIDFTLETESDGTVICWLSEYSTSPGQYRLKGMHGIALRPDTSYFETRVKITNPTPLERPFMWWENAAVHVNSDYQLFFPPDVRYVHHHHDRSHTTFPLAKGWYCFENFQKPTDIRFYRNTIKGTSYFAGPSKYDFFGGYDHQKNCGIIHVGNHHISPGKKMFHWGHEDLSRAWIGNTTDTDGEYAELMAGTYTDDQPDFSWIAPFETKTFSQYWYPIHNIKIPVIANLHGAISVEKNGGKGKIRLISTRVLENTRLVVSSGETIVVDVTVSLAPSECLEFDAVLGGDQYSVQLLSAGGKELLSYAEEKPGVLRIPEDNPGAPFPHKIKTAQELYLAGRHVDLYRYQLWEGAEYYKCALDRDPEYIPALLGMAEYYYNHAEYEKALRHVKNAIEIRDGYYDHNPSDGKPHYLAGLCHFALRQFDEAYNAFYKASWSHNSVSFAMPFIAAIDGQRRDFESMKKHALEAVEREQRHPLALVYAALADWKLGNKAAALERLETFIDFDKLNHFARFAAALITEKKPGDFFQSEKLSAAPSLSCMDISFWLMDAGMYEEAVFLLEGLKTYRGASAMALYTLAYAYTLHGDKNKAIENCRTAGKNPLVDIFPYQLQEITVLENALAINPRDGAASYLLACVLYDKKQPEKAEKFLLNAIKYLPDFYIPYRNLAVAYYSYLKQPEKALPLLKKALSLKPRNDVLLKEINYVMARQGEDGNARVQFLEENKPEKLSDNLVMDMAAAYSNIGNYEKALGLLESHVFAPAEFCEQSLIETYTFACFALGRRCYARADFTGALEWFQKAQKLPENLHAGWWDSTVLYYVRYFEALSFSNLGNETECKQVIEKMLCFVKNAYSPVIGYELEYYIAQALRLGGDITKADRYIGGAIVTWERELENDLDRKPMHTAFYISYLDDPVVLEKAAYTFALGFGRLYFDDPVGARKLFEESLRLNPDNVKAKLELEMLERGEVT
jgi:tetratricopeptide (TPR) repeat protein